MKINKKLINKSILNREYAWFGRYKRFEVNISYIFKNGLFLLLIKDGDNILFSDLYLTLDSAHRKAESWVKENKKSSI